VHAFVFPKRNDLHVTGGARHLADPVHDVAAKGTVGGKDFNGSRISHRNMAGM